MGGVDSEGRREAKWRERKLRVSRTWWKIGRKATLDYVFSLEVDKNEQNQTQKGLKT